MNQKHIDFTTMVWFVFFVFLAVRLYFIVTFPPFTDESLYVRWGQLMLSIPDYRWISIAQFSRQPLAFWMLGLGSSFARDPVIGARLIMLLVNIPVFFSLYRMTKKFSNEMIAIVAVGILSVTPLFILTQSLAMMDGFLFAFAAYILYIVDLEWVERKTWVYCITLGILIGASLWIKTTGLYLLLFTLTSLIRKARNEKQSVRYLVKILFVLTITIGIIMIPLFVRPDLSRLFQEPSSFVFSLSDLMLFPIKTWGTHIAETVIGLALYLDPVIFTVFIAALYTIFKRRRFDIAVWIMIPILISIFLGKNFRFRYFVYGFAAIIPYMSESLYTKFRQMPTLFIRFGLLGIFVYALFFTVHTPSYFSLFPVTSGERDYALSWPSGYGLYEARQWIESESKKSAPIILAVVDSPGNPSDYLLASYFKSQDVRIAFLTVTTPLEFNKILTLTRQTTVYLVTRSSLIPPWAMRNLTQITSFSKPYSTETVSIYKIGNNPI